MQDILKPLPVAQILMIAAIVAVFAAGVAYARRIRISRKILTICAGGGVVMTIVSLLVSRQRQGGTIWWTHRGWPHIFFTSSAEIPGGLAPGTLGIYIIANVIFYAAAFLLIAALIGHE